MVSGWRLGCMRIDSSRVSSIRTGRPVRRASSAVCAWIVMSSLPPNAPPFGHEFDEQPLFRLAEHGGDLPAILEDALALAVDVQAPVGQRLGEARLRLEEQVLDALGRPFAADDMRRRGERRLDVAARIARRREHVVVLGIDLRRARLDAPRRGRAPAGSGSYSTSTSAAASRARRGVSAATAASTSPT